VIVIAHRPKALAAVDYVGVVQGGKLVAFGPKDKVVGEPARPIPFPAAAAATA
jgi:ABC-type protease/lipase transport system fused ATPase/permease subunit